MNSRNFAFMFLILAASLVFLRASGQEETRIYQIYVEPLPAEGKYASNAVYEATKAWEDANPDIKFYMASDAEHADLIVQWVKDFGSVNGRVGQEISGGHLINVGFGDSNCHDKWQPYSSNTVVHIAKHEIGHFLGLPHSSDPNDVMYPITNVQYATNCTSAPKETDHLYSTVSSVVSNQTEFYGIMGGLMAAIGLIVMITQGRKNSQPNYWNT